MAFSYDPTTDRGRVRLALADTEAAKAWFSDEEIDAALSYQSSVEGACGQLAMSAVAHAARHTSSRSRSGGGTAESVDDTSRVEAWRALADAYRPFMRRGRPAIEAYSTEIPTDAYYRRPVIG